MLNQNSTIKYLFTLNLKWHLSIAKDILIRYKIFFVFFTLLFATSVSSIKTFFLFLTTPLFSENISFNGQIASFVIYLLLGITWITAQYTFFKTQDWDKYLLTLPISTRVIYQLTLLKLITINWFLWVPLIWSFIIKVQTLSSCMQLFFIVAKFVLILYLILQFQLLWIKFFINKKIHKSLSLNMFSPLKKIQIENFWLLHKSQLILPFLAVIFAYLICGLANLKIENPTAQNIMMSFSILLIPFSLSSLFLKLKNQRKSIQSYLSALPISSLDMMVNDMSLANLALCLFLIPIWIVTLTTLQKLNIIKLVLMPFIFLGISYFPQITFKKYGYFLTFVLLCVFVFFENFLFS